MNEPVDVEGGLDDPRELGKWARVFGQHQRGIAVAVNLVIFLLLCATGGPLWYLVGEGYRYGNMGLFWGSIAGVVLWAAAVVYMSIPRWGGKLQERIVRRLFGSAGHVTIGVRQTDKRRRLLMVAIVAFMACIAASVVFSFLFHPPTKYMQPISALYMVPFLVALTLLMRPAVGLIALIWPMLYGLHAVLIVAGAPILFTGRWDGLNMVLPTCGYGILAGVVSYAYSRYALRKLRRLARTGLTDADADAEATQP